MSSGNREERVRECSQCGRENPESVDWCAGCGAFLDAEPRPPRASGPAPSSNGSTTAALAAPPQVRAQEEMSLQLFYADRADAGPGGVRLRVPAGGRVTLVARVRNQSKIVDSYRLRVDHLPEGWWSIDPPTAYLLPISDRDGYDADVVIALHPPRTWQAEARVWQFDVVATSETHALETRAHATVEIEPFAELALAARPVQTVGRRGARLLAGVENSGNSALGVLLTATDAADRLRIQTPVVPAEVRPGGIGEVEVRVRPKRVHWIGAPIDHRLDLVAHSSADPELKATTPAAYRQQAWIPWWLPVLLLLLAIVAVVLYLLWPHHVKVPDVRDEPSPFAAQKKLENAGLTLNPNVRVAVRPKVTAGTVIDQAPAPGKTVDKGKSVTVVVAAGKHTVEVPKLKGLLLKEADQRLHKARLTLGVVQPKLAPNGRVGSQLPPAGERRREGTPVSVVLAKSRPKGKGNGKGKGKGKGKGAPSNAPKKGGTPPGTAPAIPAGAGAAAAAKKIADAGLTPQVKLVVDVNPRGTVLRTEPPAGEKPADGKTVSVIVSAGFPKVAYESLTQSLVAEGATGKPLPGIFPGGELASRGAWDPNGKTIAFVSNSRLYTTVPQKKGATRKLVPTGSRVPLQPSFAPLLEHPVLVFGTPPGKNGRADVCWMRRAAQWSKPHCRPVNAPEIDGFSWSPDGTVLLVSARNSKGFGLLRLESRTPFASDAGQWQGGHSLYTYSRAGRGVLAASFSPDGKKLALVSNLATGQYVVSIVPADALAGFKSPKPSALAGCDVDWRADGQELLVTQSGYDCAPGGVGPIVRVPVDKQYMLRTVVLAGRHASYQPLNITPEPGPVPGPGIRP